MHTITNYWLVAISVLMAVLASYSALSFEARVATARKFGLLCWLAGGAFVMGLGIWTMHYLGMLAVRLPVEVVYHVPTVLLSLALAVAASAVVFVFIYLGKQKLDPLQITIASVLMAAGIGGMHYLGMHAMRSSAMHQYDPAMVGVSIVTAVIFSWGALWIVFSMHRSTTQMEGRRVAGAIVMGLGIAAMHYMGMAAVSFVPGAMTYSLDNTVRISTIGAIAVALITGVILLSTILTGLLDRRMYRQVLEGQERLYGVAESSADAFFLCEAVRNKKGEIIDFVFRYLNSNVEKLVTVPRASMLDGSMRELFPTMDRIGLFELYTTVVRGGHTIVHEFAIDDETIRAHWLRAQALKLRDGIALTLADVTARKLSEQRLLQAREFAQSTIDALSSHICVLDETSAIIAMNRAWKDFAEANRAATTKHGPDGGAGDEAWGMGTNYIGACDGATGTEAAEPFDFAEGVRDVLVGARDDYSKEYACHSAEAQRWFLSKVTRFFIEGRPRVVIERINITERKLAEEHLPAATLKPEEEAKQLEFQRSVV